MEQGKRSGAGDPIDERSPSEAVAAVDELRASLRGFVASFRAPSLAKAQVALFAFSLTEWAAYIALVVYAFEEGGPARVGVISAITLAAVAITAPISSVLGDRHRRERVLTFAYAGLAGGTAATAAAMLFGLSPAIVYAAATVSASALTLVRPTHGALLPALANTPGELTAAYAAAGLIQSICVLLAPLLAGVVLAGVTWVSGPGAVDAVLAVLLAGGTMLVASIRVVVGERTDDWRGEAPSGVRREVAAGITTVWRDPRPRLIVALLGLITVVLGFVDIAIVVLAFDVLGTGDSGVGFLNAAMGAGALIGASAAVVVAGRRRLFGSFRAGVLLNGLPLVAIAGAPVLAPPALAGSAVGMAIADVTGVTMLQRVVPDARLTRVFGVLEALYMAGEGVGTLIASVIVVAAGPRWMMLFGGLFLPIVGFGVRRRIADLDVGARVPEHEMAILRRTEIFGVLPGPALERVAANAVPVVVPAGSVIVRRGEPGDRYFAIQDGAVRVERDGRTLAELGPGDGFGEIALLYDMPRTATVHAIGDCRLLALERAEFLRALSGHGEASMAAHVRAGSLMPEAWELPPADD
ncbi:MAG: MFS transporter [Actinomycetota bacterium]